LQRLRTLVFLLACACTAALMAQTNTTSLGGTILDPTGALIPGASVSLTNPATNLTKVVQSSDAGSYMFEQVLPGDYIVTVDAAGFRKPLARYVCW
jgi:Carboxypeptidase regulatory-like domain